MNKRRKKWGIVAAMVSALVMILSYAIYRTDRTYRAERVVDGETILFEGGSEVKLMGVNLSGSDNSMMAAEYLRTILGGRNVWLEFDRGNRNEAWVWVGCESVPKLLSSNLRRTGENPIGCQKGVLVNEQIIKMGWAKPVDSESTAGKYKTRIRGAAE